MIAGSTPIGSRPAISNTQSISGGGDEVKQSALWAQSLSYNSCTTSLREQIDMNYKKLQPAFQGAITSVWKEASGTPVHLEKVHSELLDLI